MPDRCRPRLRAAPARRALSLAAAAVALVAAALLLPTDPVRSAHAQVAADGRCPHRGRGPQPVVVPPETSPDFEICNGSSQVTSAVITVTSSSSDYCPRYTRTGITYYPPVPKPNHEIVESARLENIHREWRCGRSPFWGILSSVACRVRSTSVCQIELTVLLDRPCAPTTVAEIPE